MASSLFFLTLQPEDLVHVDQEEKIWKPTSNFSNNNLHVLLFSCKTLLGAFQERVKKSTNEDLQHPS